MTHIRTMTAASLMLVAATGCARNASPRYCEAFPVPAALNFGAVPINQEPAFQTFTVFTDEFFDYRPEIERVGLAPRTPFFIDEEESNFAEGEVRVGFSPVQEGSSEIWLHIESDCFDTTATATGEGVRP